MPDLTYKQNVQSVFDHVYSDSWSMFFENDFWHTANTLDTCTDFIIEGSKKWGDVPDQRGTLQEMIQKSYGYFLDTYNEQNPDPPKPNGKPQSDKVWWDDYGWWGIAFTKIYRSFPLIFKGVNKPPVSPSDCLDVARKCWVVLGIYSQDVNGTVKPPKKGPVPGGCWNHRPESGGIQNSVTNELYLILSGRLYEATNKPEYLEETARQYLWFRDWYVNFLLTQKQCPLPGEQNGLFRCLLKDEHFNTFLVVYERPHDPNPPYTGYNRGTPDFLDKQLWSGDQGLFLGGLATVLDAAQAMKGLQSIHDGDPTFPANAQSMAKNVALGVNWLFDTKSVLHEAPLNGIFNTEYAADYATGKGVVMRYLAYAASKVGLNFAKPITESAQAVLQSKKGNQIDFQWNLLTDSKIGTNESKVIQDQKSNPDARFKPTAESAGLDALNAAIPQLG